VGSSVITEIPLTDKYKRWADEASKLFGGMDILTVDSIFANGKGTESLHHSLEIGLIYHSADYILEINDTASGFYGPNEKEVPTCSSLHPYPPELSTAFFRI